MTTTASRPVSPPASPSARSTQHHRIAGLVAAFGIGTLVAVQSRVNGDLATRLGDGIAAALISFWSGLLILLVLAALSARVRAALGRVWSTIRTPAAGVHRAARRPGEQGLLRWWQCAGGVAGAFMVATQSITVGVIGVAVFIVAGVAGQAVSSLVVDRLGFGPAGPQAYTPTRVVGAVIAVAAVVLAVSDRLNHPAGLLLAVLPALAGIGSAVQQAINGRVARTASLDAYGAVAAAVVNFLVGSAALTVVFLIDLVLRGAPHALPTEPWLYVGGACGVAFISLAAAVVRVVGVFVLGLGTIAGQLIGSLFIDLFLPATDQAVTWPVVTGTLLALLAVVVAALPSQRRLIRQP